jgi:hypothetical protein
VSAAARSAAILCADDYAMTEGISRGIEELAAAGRISAASAMVTTRHWALLGSRVRELGREIAVGLHLNLTLGRPLGAMPGLAPAGVLPRFGTVLEAALLRRIDPDETAAETGRQIARFVEVAGRRPDFVDGHQHVHALPAVRAGVLKALSEAFPGREPLVRNPADTPLRILARRAAVPKSLLLALIARGFGQTMRAAGFATNHGFAGVSTFDRGVPYAVELARFLSAPGPLHLVMCHPGRVDAELATLDPVVERRQDELEALATFPDLPARILRLERDASGTIVWPAAAPRR